MKTYLLTLISTSIVSIAAGQSFKGTILHSETNSPIEYVNVGIVGKNNGTVSDEKGNYSLEIPQEFDSDTLKVSCIGYHLDIPAMLTPFPVMLTTFLVRCFEKERLFVQILPFFS